MSTDGKPNAAKADSSKLNYLKMTFICTINNSWHCFLGKTCHNRQAQVVLNQICTKKISLLVCSFKYNML